MKLFDYGMLVGFIATMVGVGIGRHYTDTTLPVTYEQSVEAVSKCSNGEWEKIGETYIYCKDGGKYELENKQ